MGDDTANAWNTTAPAPNPGGRLSAFGQSAFGSGGGGAMAGSAGGSGGAFGGFAGKTQGGAQGGGAVATTVQPIAR